MVEKKEKIKCSVGILTFNSGKTLDRALESVKEFTEIIICDGGSTDNTLEIAQKYKSRIIYQDKKFKNPDGSLNDFGAAKNQLVAAASYDWVLIVDSDEYLSQELVEEIRYLDFSQTKVLYNILRKYIINDELIELASTYPSYQIRLFNKVDGIRFIKKVHERPKYDASHQIKNTKNHFFIPIEPFNLKDVKRKNDKYITIQINMWESISFKTWMKMTISSLRASAAYLFKLFLVQFKSGKKLPFNYEMSRHYYNLSLIIRSIKKIR